MNTCKVCSKTNENMQICSACKSVDYCSRDCQKLDWKSHKTSCFRINQIYLSDKAIETVFDNKPFNKMVQYIHHFNITESAIKDKLMLCFISPNFDKLDELESYSCIINVVPINEFSEEIKKKVDSNKRAAFFTYYDKLHYDMNSTKGSIINFNFDYDKRDAICYESIKTLDLPTMLTVYLDGRCE